MTAPIRGKVSPGRGKFYRQTVIDKELGAVFILGRNCTDCLLCSVY